MTFSKIVAMNKPSFLLLLLISFLSSCESKTEKRPYQTLWFESPAKEWEEALPLGNGRLGMMVFGDPINDRIQLNDDSLWPKDLDWEHPEGGPEDLKAIRAALDRGDAATADSLLVEKFSNKTIVRSHQTLGDLYLQWNHKNVANYKRSLDLEEAVATTTYTVDGYQVEQKAFVSHPHQIMLITLQTAHPDGLEGTLWLDRPKDEGLATVQIETLEQGLIMRGEITQQKGAFRTQPAPIKEGIAFETQLQAQAQGGSITSAHNQLKVKGAQSLTLMIATNSTYYTPHPDMQNKAQLEAVQNLDSKTLQAIHTKDHQSLFNRVTLHLEEEQPFEHLATDKRLAQVKNKTAQDNGLSQLLFDYGRYLLIASSRPGSLPANLQGLWNQHINAPWNADYHLNINLQMNYWLANLTQLHELNQPLFDYVDRLVTNGKVTAQQNFGCRGSFLPHATDLWAPTWLRAPTAYWGASFAAGGWLMQHYWEHYQFTQDRTFLKERAFPALHEVAQFYSDWLQLDPRDGTLIAYPSTSPENRYINATGAPVASCKGSAMDQQVIFEVFTNYLKTSEELGLTNELTQTISKQLPQLRSGFVLGKDGRILEWDRPYTEHEPGHRHMSHLYGFHPGSQVTALETPELFKAVKTTLEHRLANGGAGTGWSRAWLINCAARLLDGAMVEEHIQLLFEKSIYTNLFDAHPPFQIDGNFGFTAGVAEALLQSHEKNTLRLLPGLPPLWKNGSVSGLVARGNIVVNLEWKEGKITTVELHSATSQTVNLIYNNTTEEVELAKGKTKIIRTL